MANSKYPFESDHSTDGKNVLKVTVVRNMSGRYQTLTLGSDPSGKIERLKVYSKKETIMRI